MSDDHPSGSGQRSGRTVKGNTTPSPSALSDGPERRRVQVPTAGENESDDQPDSLPDADDEQE